MLKVVGSILIICTCTVMGVDKSNEISMRRKELEELHRIFSLYQVERTYFKKPIGEIVAKIQNKAGKKFRVWLRNLAETLENFHQRSFDEIWISSIETHFKESFLTKSELEELKQIGKNISHPEAIRLYLIQLDNAIQTTREEEKEKKKLYQSMGIMAGIFLVIMLI